MVLEHCVYELQVELEAWQTWYRQWECGDDDQPYVGIVLANLTSRNYAGHDEHFDKDDSADESPGQQQQQL